MKIIFCKNCLYGSTHPLGITFDNNGICSGCTVHKEKYTLDWRSRFSKLSKVIAQYRSRKNNYDCIIPITGAQDSYFIVHTAKKLGLKPLLVCYNKYFNTDVGIKNLSNLRIKFNLDVLFQNVNPNTVKKITRETLSRFGNIYWPIIAGHTVFPVQISIKYKIPLIIWGAHQGIEQVGMNSHEDEVEMSRRYRKDHDLFGYEAEDLLMISNNLKEADIYQYLYPDDYTLKKNSTRGIYLGNYIPWDTKKQHELMIKIYNYKTINFTRTIDCYDYVDCFNYMNIHDLLKIYKHGYSKITDQLSREIRFGRIDRESALKVVKKFEKRKPKFTKLFCDWLDVDYKSLNFVTESFINLLFWKKINLDNFKFMGWSYLNKLQSKKKIIKKKFSYTVNTKLKNNLNYITFGKGFG